MHLHMHTYALTRELTCVLDAVCMLAGVIAYMYQSAWIFPVLMAFGGIVTSFRDMK